MGINVFILSSYFLKLIRSHLSVVVTDYFATFQKSKEKKATGKILHNGYREVAKNVAILRWVFVTSRRI
jgi:hypothetical protein